jgi:hypothetical protein
LDIFDEILEEATHYEENQIYIMCDSPQFEKVSNWIFMGFSLTNPEFL